MAVLVESRRRGSVELLPRHPFIILGLATLALAFIGALTSKQTFQALVGYGGTESLSVLGMLLLGLWVLLTFYGSRGRVVFVLRALIASGSILSLVTVLALVGIRLYAFGGNAFNPAGTTTTAGIIAAATIILAAGNLLQAPSRRAKIWSAVALAAPVILVLGAGFRVPLIMLAIGIATLALFGARGALSRLSSRATAVLLLGGIVALILAIWPVTTFLTTPLEVGPSHNETWSIAAQTLKESPVFGARAAGFSAAYLAHRSFPIVQTPFWNVSFDWGSSAALTFLTTLGWFGGILMILTVLSVLISYKWALFRGRVEASRQNVSILAAGAALFVGALLAPMPFAARFFFDTLLGLMLAISAAPIVVPLRAFGRAALFASLDMALAIVLALGLLLMQGKRVTAEVFAAAGVNSLGQDLASAEKYFARATALDSRNDMYLRLLSESRRAALRDAINSAASTGDSAALEVIRAQADSTLTAARAAADRAPGAAANWVTLGSVYLDIAPITAGASAQAQTAFERARALSPSDPAILVNLGVAQGLAARAASGEEAQTLQNTAAETLRRASELRPNYVFAYLELARLYVSQNQVEEALAAYRNAEAIAPDDAALRYEVGLYLMQQDRKDEARGELEAAIVRAENFSNARWFLAQILEEQSDIAGAIAQITKIIELNPENASATARLAELQGKLE